MRDAGCAVCGAPTSKMTGKPSCKHFPVFRLVRMHERDCQCKSTPAGHNSDQHCKVIGFAFNEGGRWFTLTVRKGLFYLSVRLVRWVHIVFGKEAAPSFAGKGLSWNLRNVVTGKNW